MSQVLLLNVYGQPLNIKFKHLTADRGLSSNRITCIFRDTKDFLWVGTEMGLNKFDGYQVTPYLKDETKNSSLSDNSVRSIVEDSQHNLWVGTKNGLNFYNRASNSFTRYQNKASDPNSISSNSIISMHLDRKGNLWILAGGNCLNLWNPQKKRFTRYFFSPPVERSFFAASSIGEDSRGNIWVSCYGDDLYCLKPGTKKFQSYKLGLESEEKTLNNIYVDKKDKVWVGTRGAGLHLFNPISKTTEHFPVNKKGTGTNKSLIHWIIGDDDKHLLIAVDQGGLNRLNVETRKFTYLEENALDPEGLNTNGVWTLFKDKEGILWVGTANGGVNYYNPKEYRFGLYRVGTTNEYPSSNTIDGFLEDSKGKIWITTDNGLNSFNPNSGTFSYYKHDPANPRSISVNSLRNAEEDLDGNIWVGTWDGGLNRFNPTTATFDRFYPNTGSKPFNVSGRHIWYIKRDHKGLLWLSTLYVGIDVLDPKKGILKRFKKDLKNPYGLGSDIVQLIAEDRQKNIWACTSEGLYRYDNRVDGFIGYKHFPDNDIRAFIQDRKGTYWVGSANKGLFAFNHQGRVTRTFDTGNGLANNQVHAIVEDNAGKLWISTNSGLSRLDPSDGTIRNFYVGDGLQGNQFFGQSFLKTRNGEIYFGGYNGFNFFKPENLKNNNYNSPVYITDLQIFNKSVNPETPDSPLEQQITETEQITLTAKQSMFSLSFAATNYTFSANTQYAYKLEGFDKEWNYVGNKRSATFTNLDAGDYRFLVKASNNDGIWNNKYAALRITVLPPWYQTWYAYLFYICFCVALIYLYLRYRIREAKLDFEIKTAHFEAEKEKELHRKKVDFFTSISHEFRSPLTLIINPLKEMLYDESKELNAGKLTVVYRNARRLLSLVDQLLLFRKSENEMEQLKVSCLNISRVCEEVHLCFTNQARLQNIQLEFHSDQEEIELFADREKIEIILFNLISNALKFTPPKGKVVLSVSESENQVEIKVADTGSGIPEYVGDKLFEQFYQVNNQNAISKRGFGIGLYLVKSFIEAHKGSVSYSSEENKGTEFKLAFPKGKEHFHGGTIIEEEPQESVVLDELIEDRQNELDGKDEDFGQNEKNTELYSEIKTILIIDDNSQIRKYIKQLFDGEFEVLEADNGATGLEMIREVMPDIVISDVMMQGLSGIELCSRVKEDPAMSHIPIVLLTASSSAEVKLKGIECGAEDFISKPFEKEILIARIGGILKSRNNLQNYFYNKITLRPDNSKISGEYKDFLEKCIQIVEAHIADEDFRVTTLSEKIGMSRTNLYLRIRSISGQSGISFIRSIRLRKAAEIFVTTEYNISEVAYMVGMKDVKYFREQFNKLFGMNPSEYIKRYRKQFNQNHTIKKK